MLLSGPNAAKSRQPALVTFCLETVSQATEFFGHLFCLPQSTYCQTSNPNIPQAAFPLDCDATSLTTLSAFPGGPPEAPPVPPTTQFQSQEYQLCGFVMAVAYIQLLTSALVSNYRVTNSAA